MFVPKLPGLQVLKRTKKKILADGQKVHKVVQGSVCSGDRLSYPAQMYFYGGQDGSESSTNWSTTSTSRSPFPVARRTRFPKLHTLCTFFHHHQQTALSPFLYFHNPKTTSTQISSKPFPSTPHLPASIQIFPRQCFTPVCRRTGARLSRSATEKLALSTIEWRL